MEWGGSREYLIAMDFHHVITRLHKAKQYFLLFFFFSFSRSLSFSSQLSPHSCCLPPEYRMRCTDMARHYILAHFQACLERGRFRAAFTLRWLREPTCDETAASGLSRGFEVFRWVRWLLLPRHLKSWRWNPSGKLLIEAGKLAHAEKKLQSKIGEETSKTPFLTILAGLRRDEARGEVYHDLLLSAPEAGWAGWGGFRLFSEHNTYLSNCMWGTSRAGSNMQTAPALTPSTLWKTLHRLCESNIIGRIIFALSPLINAFLSVALVRRRIDRTYLFTERLGGRCDRAAGDSTHLRSAVIKDDGQCLYTVRKF